MMAMFGSARARDVHQIVRGAALCRIRFDDVLHDQKPGTRLHVTPANPQNFDAVFVGPVMQNAA